MKRHKTKAIVLSLALTCAGAFASLASADAYDAALSRAIAAKEKALDAKNDILLWEDAEHAFEDADDLKPTAQTKYEIGNAAVHLGEDDVAVQSYEAALALGLDGKPKEKARAFVDAHVATMARLDVRGPAGAVVYLGARRRGVLPLARPLVVFAGSIKLRVVDKSGESNDAFTVAAGESKVVDVAKKSSAGAGTASTGSVAPLSSSAPPPKPDDAPKTTAGSSGASTLGWSLVVAGGLVTVGSLATVVLAQSSLSSARDSLNADCPNHQGDDCPVTSPGLGSAAKSDVDKIATDKTLVTMGYVGVGLGVVSLGLGVVRLLTLPPSSAPTHAHVEPRLTFGNGGFVLGVSGAL